MGLLSVLVLLTDLAVTGQGNPAKPQPAEPAVPIVKDALEAFTLKQVTSANWPVVAETSAPVSTLESGLSHVRKFSKRPILAMSETKDGFFYGTVVVPDEKGRPSFFHSGYAIKRDGRQVTEFSFW